MRGPKHAPGPWRLEANRIYGGSYPEGVAHVMDADLGEVRDANARLILAAPDLLQGAKDLLLCEDGTKEQRNAALRLWKAVNKAEGL